MPLSPEAKAKKAAYMVVWHQNNKERRRTAVRANHRRWVSANPKKQAALNRRSFARRLARGKQILNTGNHHTGMAELKALMGDPRPEGLTLSLINYDSPDVYLGYDYRRGKRVPYRLSTNPDDYAWETQAENLARRRPYDA